MKTIVKKVVVLEDYEKNTLREAIRILEELSDEGVEESWMDGLVADLTDIAYRDEWEVERDD